MKIAEKKHEDLLKISFKHRNDLLYNVEFNDDKERLCISTNLEKKIFQLMYDDHYHVDFQ